MRSESNLQIGASFSVESVKIVSDLLQQSQLPSVIDLEPIFKTRPAPKPELIIALIKEILPYVTIVSATIPEVKAILDEAGIVTDYPKNMGRCKRNGKDNARARFQICLHQT